MVTVGPLGESAEPQVTSLVVLFGVRPRLGVRACVSPYTKEDGDRVSVRRRKEEGEQGGHETEKDSGITRSRARQRDSKRKKGRKRICEGDDEGWGHRVRTRGQEG